MNHIYVVLQKRPSLNKNTAPLAFPVVVNARFLSANVSKDGFSHGLGTCLGIRNGVTAPKMQVECTHNMFWA